MVYIHIFASSLLPLSSECHKGEFGGRRGFPLSQRSFLLVWHLHILSVGF